MSRISNQRLRIVAEISNANAAQAQARASEAQAVADQGRTTLAMAELADRREREARDRQIMADHQQMIQARRDDLDRTWAEHIRDWQAHSSVCWTCHLPDGGVE